MDGPVSSVASPHRAHLALVCAATVAVRSHLTKPATLVIDHGGTYTGSWESDDADTPFDLPLLIEGTEFQRRLWQALCEIPRGTTRTYGELAKRLEVDARAIGQACGDNRLPIVIPCHRVVAANGIGGFAHATGGYLVEAKRWLLAHECGTDAFELTP